MTPRANSCAFWSMSCLSCLIGLLFVIRSAEFDFGDIRTRAQMARAEMYASTPMPSVNRSADPKNSTTDRTRPQRAETVLVPISQLPSRLSVSQRDWSELDIPPGRVVGIKFRMAAIQVRRDGNKRDFFLYRNSKSPPKLSSGPKLRNPLERFSNKPDTYWFEKGIRRLQLRAWDKTDEVIEIMWREEK